MCATPFPHSSFIILNSSFTLVFRHDIEAWAGFPRIQIPMPYNQGTRIFPVQRLQQLAQGNPLGIRPGVFRFPIGRQPADIAHPDAVTVMILAMRPYFGFVPSLFDGSVRRNHVVIPAALPAQRTVIAVDVRQAQGTARLVGGAVHDDQRDGSHKAPAQDETPNAVSAATMACTMA